MTFSVTDLQAIKSAVLADAIAAGAWTAGNVAPEPLPVSSIYGR